MIVCRGRLLQQSILLVHTNYRHLTFLQSRLLQPLLQFLEVLAYLLDLPRHAHHRRRQVHLLKTVKHVEIVHQHVRQHLYRSLLLLAQLIILHNLPYVLVNGRNLQVETHCRQDYSLHLEQIRKFVLTITKINVLFCFHGVDFVVLAGSEEGSDSEKLKILLVKDVSLEDEHVVDELDTHMESFGFYFEFPGDLDQPANQDPSHFCGDLDMLGVLQSVEEVEMVVVIEGGDVREDVMGVIVEGKIKGSVGGQLESFRLAFGSVELLGGDVGWVGDMGMGRWYLDFGFNSPDRLPFRRGPVDELRVGIVSHNSLQLLDLPLHIYSVKVQIYSVKWKFSLILHQRITKYNSNLNFLPTLFIPCPTSPFLPTSFRSSYSLHLPHFFCLTIPPTLFKFYSIHLIYQYFKFLTQPTSFPFFHSFPSFTSPHLSPIASSLTLSLLLPLFLLPHLHIYITRLSLLLTLSPLLFYLLLPFFSLTPFFLFTIFKFRFFFFLDRSGLSFGVQTVKKHGRLGVDFIFILLLVAVEVDRVLMIFPSGQVGTGGMMGLNFSFARFHMLPIIFIYHIFSTLFTLFRFGFTHTQVILKKRIRHIQLAIKAQSLPLLADFFVFFKVVFGELESANGAWLFAMILILMFSGLIDIIQEGAVGALFDVAEAVAEVSGDFGCGDGLVAIFALLHVFLTHKFPNVKYY